MSAEKVHRLRVRPVEWEALQRGHRLFEVKRDAGFNRGDIVALECWHISPFERRKHSSIMGQVLERRITYSLVGEKGRITLALEDVAA